MFVPLRALSTSARAARTSRVSALDFQLGTKDAVHRARLGALEQLLPTIKGRWGGIAFAVSQALGLGWMTESEEDVMRFESAQALYYPIWVRRAPAYPDCRRRVEDAVPRRCRPGHGNV
ncbi:hypothetical protein GLX27_003267 [Malassezia furfur]|uniref:Uncharacterized protein n=1 Tax=Malassezia furfur TaxID=55194 RepID=A0ABY8ESU5_MALFU|nr:hypothetical protein GLX27_003267 [Malassezia furfur]